ncbi:MAG: deoxycytidylate deaminase [Cytophagaceae bacterium]
MKKPAFDDIFMELAINLARRSHCIKKHVGAVLTKETRIISIGYNGPPMGTHNCDEEWPETGCAKDMKGSCSLALHAEENAIVYAMKNGFSIEKCTLYITLSPCLPCARLIYSAGVEKVIFLESYAHYKGIGMDEGVEFLRRFGVDVQQYKGELVQTLNNNPL